MEFHEKIANKIAQNNEAVYVNDLYRWLAEDAEGCIKAYKEAKREAIEESRARFQDQIPKENESRPTRQQIRPAVFCINSPGGDVTGGLSLFENSDSIDLADLGREKTVLFLNVSDTDATFDRIVNIIYAQALQMLCHEADARPDGRLKVPVLIIIDDFAASVCIPGFDKMISVIRSRDISVSLVLQSLTQLETMYTAPAAKTIVNNCDHLIYLGCRDLDTANFIAHHIGKAPEAVLAMPLSDSVIITKGEKARQVKKIVPYSTLELETA